MIDAKNIGGYFCTMATLMRQMTVPSLQHSEMESFIHANCGGIYNQLNTLRKETDYNTLIDFVYTTIEVTGLRHVIERCGTLPEIHAIVLGNLIDEIMERGMLRELTKTDMGKTWYGSIVSSHFNGSIAGKQIRHVCKKRIEKLKDVFIGDK